MPKVARKPRLPEAVRVTALPPLEPAEVEAPFRERGPDRARDVWPSLGPVEAQSTEVTAF